MEMVQMRVAFQFYLQATTIQVTILTSEPTLTSGLLHRVLVALLGIVLFGGAKQKWPAELTGKVALSPAVA